MRIVALIPARGGSKRLPGKNIKDLNGIPLIAYAINAAKEAGISDVYVSTDCKDIAKISEKYGAQIPFVRPAEIANDEASDLDVIKHFLGVVGWDNYDFVFYLRPTTLPKDKTVFRQVEQKIQTGKYSAVRTVNRINAKNHPYWMFKEVDHKLLPFIENISIAKYHQSQLLPECFAINGLLDAFSVQNIKDNNALLGANVGSVLTESKIFDIDELRDFEECAKYFEGLRHE